MNKGITIVGIIGIVLLVWLLSSSGPMKKYESSSLGISFSYPDKYTLTERDLGSQYVVTLVEDTSPRENSEGPTSINFVVNKGQTSTPESWIRTSPASNYNLKIGEYEEVKFRDLPGVFYTADGLYLSDNHIFSYNNSIVHISVTYLTQDDVIRKDLAKILKTLKFATGGIKGKSQQGQKPYQTDLELVDFKSLRVVKKFSSKLDGTFSITAYPGEYMINSAKKVDGKSECGKNGLVPVEINKYSEVIVFCDTGIR
jgi:hypothetical protein